MLISGVALDDAGAPMASLVVVIFVFVAACEGEGRELRVHPGYHRLEAVPVVLCWGASRPYIPKTPYTRTGNRHHNSQGSAGIRAPVATDLHPLIEFFEGMVEVQCEPQA